MEERDEYPSAGRSSSLKVVLTVVTGAAEGTLFSLSRIISALSGISSLSAISELRTADPGRVLAVQDGGETMLRFPFLLGQ